MMPSLSVIVCTTGRQDDLSVCLRSLQKQEYAPAEILVVDTDPDDTAKRLLVQRRFPGCLYIPESQKGMATARNTGLVHSLGEIVAFLDDRCRPVAGWSHAIARNFLQMPILGCCTGPVLPLELKARPQRLLEEMGGIRKGFARCLVSGGSPLDLSAYDPLQGRRLGSGANMAFRRSVFSTIGGFDTGLRSAEDLEMFFRVVRSGYDLIYEPRAVVFHRHPATYKELRRTLHSWGRGYISLLLKIAHTDPLYRKKALSEASAWFGSFHANRLWDRLSRKKPSFPIGLVLVEMAGGARAVARHLIHPAAAKERESGTTLRFFSPFIRLLRRWT